VIPFLFLIISYYIVNATVPLTIPLQISPNAVGTATTAPQATPTTQSILGIPLDAATISGLIGLGTTFLYRWKKNDNRQTVQTQTTAKVADSLKDTDYGNKEIVNLLAGIVDQLPTLSQELKDKVKTAADEWNSDVEALYEKQTTAKTDLSSDPVIRKLGEVQKQTERNQ
jgi:hypothetical protein